MSNLRNAQLLGQVQAHPLRSSLAKALDIAETFAGDVQFLQLDKNLSDAGRQNARSAKLRAAIRDLRDARGPVDELAKKLEQKRKAVEMPAFDPKDSVGFLRRQELRSVLRTMDAGARAMHLRDPAFADALLEQPPIVSGMADDESRIVEAAKNDRLAGMFAAELAEIDALEQTVAEANMIANLARNDLKLHSAMDDRTFTEFVRPIENRQGAPWLVKNGDAVMRVRPEMRGSPQLHQPATADEIREGVFYDSEAAYLASRAA